MPKYQLTVSTTEVRIVEVEAADESEARNLAYNDSMSCVEKHCQYSVEIDDVEEV